jgi:hypothetical protein
MQSRGYSINGFISAVNADPSLGQLVERLVRAHIVEVQPYGSLNVELGVPLTTVTSSPMQEDVLTIRTTGTWP